MHLYLLPTIHLPPQAAARRIHHLPQSIRTAQRLQRLQAQPRINPHVIFPEALQLVVKTLLLGNHQLRHRLPGVFLRIPDLPRVLDRLIAQILQQLELPEIFGVVLGVEILQPLREDVGRVTVRFHRLLVQLPLRFTAGHEAVLGHVFAEPVRRLRVLPRGFQVRIAHRVAEFLQVGVRAGFEPLVEFGLIAAVVDAQVDDFAGSLGVGQVERGGAVEFDVLGCFGGVEHLAGHVEEFHGEAAGLGDAILVT